MYQEMGVELVNHLDGMFGFVICDKEKKTWMAARDPIGIIPLYYGYGKDGSVWFSSEMKALAEDCEHFEEFPPGHYYSSETKKPVRYYNPEWFSERVPSAPLDLSVLRESLEQAVVKCMMTDVPYGVLLSGGLDSSLIASLGTLEWRLLSVS
jgi:asparagine synthase (glutamine-hydrolysing)